MDTSKLRELDRIRRLSASGNFREIKTSLVLKGKDWRGVNLRREDL